MYITIENALGWLVCSFHKSLEMTRSLDCFKIMKLWPLEEQSQTRFDLRLLSGARCALQQTILLLQGST